MADADPLLNTQISALNTLPPGFRGHVCHIEGDPLQDRLVHRLYEIGFEEGVGIEVLHRSTFKDGPMAVTVGTMTVALRQSEAARIGILHNR